MNTVKTIIFDLGGVLIDLDKQACVKAFHQLGFHDIEDYLGEYIQQDFFLDLEKGKITTADYYDKVRAHCSRQDIADRDIDEAWHSFIIDIPDYKLDLLRALRKRYRLFVLSNTNDIMAPYFTRTLFTKQGLTINDYFDRIFLSHQMGEAKPHPAIFKKMIAESGIVPHEALFLDDAEKNIATATELGFQTYHVKPCEDFRPLFA